jgi:hypothetical protein
MARSISVESARFMELLHIGLGCRRILDLALSSSPVTAAAGKRRNSGSPGLQKARKVGALPELRDLQIDMADAGLPASPPVAVALGDPRRRALPQPGTSALLDLQLHQPLGPEGQHLAQKVGVRALFQKPAEGHHVGGHRGLLGSG